MEQKKTVGVYGLTGCAGCQLSIIFNEEEILALVDVIDIKSFPFIREKEFDGIFDCVFVEGLVADEEDLETLKRLRAKAKTLVALGACAHTGCVPAYRNFTNPQNYEHLYYDKVERIKDVKPTPIDAHIQVDFIIPGCPPDKHEILQFINDIAHGVEPKMYNNPVCVECRRNNNQCLLDVGKPCLGPVTRGGCNSVCTNSNFECWGCRGPTQDANYPLMRRLLKQKGYTDDFITMRMKSFVGLKLPPDAENK
jgi:sulfhydrogenase subunit delta